MTTEYKTFLGTYVTYIDNVFLMYGLGSTYSQLAVLHAADERQKKKPSPLFMVWQNILSVL